MTTPTPIPTDNIPAAPDRALSKGARWVNRIKLGIEVMFFIEIGMLLVVLPWSPLWSHNTYLDHHLAMREFMDLGFVRGALTGLGLVNIWIGIWDAVTYREE